jgi:hypothetical protein
MEDKKWSVRIESDGTPGGTKVFDATTGEQIRGVRGIKWSIGLDTVATAEIDFVVVEVNVKGETIQDVTALSDEYAQYVKA